MIQPLHWVAVKVRAAQMKAILGLPQTQQVAEVATLHHRVQQQAEVALELETVAMAQILARMMAIVTVPPHRPQLVEAVLVLETMAMVPILAQAAVITMTVEVKLLSRLHLLLTP